MPNSNVQLLGMIQALRTVVISLADSHPDRQALKSKLEAHVSNLQGAAAKEPHDELLFETEAELERFISVLSQK